MTVTPEQAIDAVNALYGRHAGFRALHAKGILLKGTFTATPQAAELTRAAHMQGQPVAATFRFSNGGGDPTHPDYAAQPRGFASKFYLADGSRTDIVAVSNEVFATRTPDAFVELLRVQKASALTKAWKMPLLIARHPELLRTLPKILPTLKLPTSYAAIRYYGGHAFKWINAEGTERWVRYTLVPERTEPRLSKSEAKSRGRNYLQDEIRARVERGPVPFTVEVQIAAPGDATDDSTKTWPSDRQRVQVGTIEITGPDTEREVGDDILVFDPAHITDGIELSDDPVLRFRPKAYSVSVERRTASSR